MPFWNERQGAFLEEIAAAGFARESVDYVVCTHLHPDHVGWNTMLIDGEWQPTFPNARYLFSEKDWAWLDQATRLITRRLLRGFRAPGIRPPDWLT